MTATTRFIPDGDGGWLRISRTEAHYFAQRIAHRLDLALEPVPDLCAEIPAMRRDRIDAAVDRYIEAAQRLPVPA